MHFEILKYFRLLNRQKAPNQWEWTKHETPTSMEIHHIYFHIPRPQRFFGDNLCAVILSSKDMGENKTCEPEDQAFIAEGELAGSDFRGITEIKSKFWSFNKPLLYNEPEMYIATVTTRQKTPRSGKAIIMYTEAKDEGNN